MTRASVSSASSTDRGWRDRRNPDGSEALLVRSMNLGTISKPTPSSLGMMGMTPRSRGLRSAAPSTNRAINSVVLGSMAGPEEMPAPTKKTSCPLASARSRDRSPKFRFDSSVAVIVVATDFLLLVVTHGTGQAPQRVCARRVRRTSPRGSSGGGETLTPSPRPLLLQWAPCSPCRPVEQRVEEQPYQGQGVIERSGDGQERARRLGVVSVLPQRSIRYCEAVR